MGSLLYETGQLKAPSKLDNLSHDFIGRIEHHEFLAVGKRQDCIGSRFDITNQIRIHQKLHAVQFLELDHDSSLAYPLANLHWTKGNIRLLEGDILNTYTSLAQTVTDLDHRLFVLINSDWTASWADSFFPFITDLQKNPIFLALFACALFYWLYKKRIEAAKWIVVLIISVAASDIITYRVLKPLVHRDRPPATNVQIVIRGEKHTGNSFPSNHSTNMFTAAMSLSGGLPFLTIPLFIVAGLIAYSRVYVGAHFPLDVIGGAVLGIFIATSVRLLLGRWLVKPTTAGAAGGPKPAAKGKIKRKPDAKPKAKSKAKPKAKPKG